MKEIDSQKVSEFLQQVYDKNAEYIIVATEQDIPLKFKEWREYRGKSLRQVAKDIDYSNSYLSQIENGKLKSIPFFIVVLLCRYYKVRLIVGS